VVIQQMIGLRRAIAPRPDEPPASSAAVELAFELVHANLARQIHRESCVIETMRRWRPPPAVANLVDRRNSSSGLLSTKS